jgi:flagellar secretion chaperone FliS
MSGANAVRRYRDVDAAGRAATATPHELVDLIYTELRIALEVMERAIVAGHRSVARTQHQRALELILTLEAGLDRVNGGELADALSQIYRQMRARLIVARRGDMGACRDIAEGIANLQTAWQRVT